MKREGLHTDREREIMDEYWKTERPFRPKLMKFVSKLDILEVPKGKGGSTIYQMFDPLITDEMLDILNVMDFRTTIYIDELAERCGQPIDHVANVMNEAAKIGFIEYWPDENGIDRYYLVQPCVGSMEYPMAGDEYFAHPEQSVLFEHYTEETFSGPGVYMPMSCRGVHRAVPVETALTADVKRMEWEELTKLIDKNAHGVYAVGECICRRAMKTMDRGVGEPCNEWCMGIGHWAEYLTRVGKAIRLTRDEFMARLKEAEDRGFVHQVAANANGTDIEYVCNCDSKTCLSMRADLFTENYSWARGNFVSQVDPDKCVACGRCVEVCPVNAVKLGQHLEPSEPIFYHYQRSAHEEFLWGKEHHHPNYGLERINVWPETGTAPCKVACPAHIAVEGYLKLANEGRYDDALRLIKYNNPFPAVCGSICNRRCEDACSRGCIDDPVAIDEVKKFIAYRELQKENRYIPKKEPSFLNLGHAMTEHEKHIMNERHPKVAVIGAGPAGLACAYYLEIKGNDVTVFEKNEKPGGMMVYGIPNFKLEKDVVAAEIDVIRELGAEFRCGIAVGKDITLEELREQGYKAFYLAVGCQGSRKSGIPGEAAEGVESAVDFLRRVTDRMSTKVSGRTVVIGGGNVAMDVARTALRCGSSSVRMFCLEQPQEMKASPEEIEEVRGEGITLDHGWGPKEVLTDKKGAAKGIVLKRCTRVFDENGRFSPLYDENDTMTVDCKNVFMSIGQCIDWGNLLKGEEAMEYVHGNYPKADPFTYQTAVPDIFTGGDVFTGPKFVIDAIAAGKQGAESIHRYIWDGDLRWGRDRLLYKEIDKSKVNFGSPRTDHQDEEKHNSYDVAGRQTPGRKSREGLSFEDDSMIFTEEQVRTETARCLRCGASHVDENKCIGCALCTTRCEFDAIHIRRIFNGRPAMHEYVYGQIAGEAVKRAAWTATHHANPPLVKVGPEINPNVSYATGAIYHRQDRTADEEKAIFEKELRYDHFMEKVDTKIKVSKGTVDIPQQSRQPGDPIFYPPVIGPHKKSSKR